MTPVEPAAVEVPPLATPTMLAPHRLLKLRSDAALTQRFAAGDEAAFAAIYDRYRVAVMAVCMGVLGSREDAEDVAQEVFTRLAAAVHEGAPRELRCWLARVARNAAIDLLRRRRDRSSLDELVYEPAAPAGTDRAELDSVLAGIRQLPEAQRTALLMRELAGLSYAEIADVLGAGEESIRGLIARARVGLRSYREAVDIPCATVRAAVAADPDARRRDKATRRHLKECAGCRTYREALRSDARVLRGVFAAPASGLAGGGTAAAFLAKGALMGGAITQATAVCAVSVCAVGGIVLLQDPALHRHAAKQASAASHARASGTAATRTGAGGGAHSPPMPIRSRGSGLGPRSSPPARGGTSASLPVSTGRTPARRAATPDHNPAQGNPPGTTSQPQGSSLPPSPLGQPQYGGGGRIDGGGRAPDSSADAIPRTNYTYGGSPGSGPMGGATRDRQRQPTGSTGSTGASGGSLQPPP